MLSTMAIDAYLHFYPLALTCILTPFLPLTLTLSLIPSPHHTLPAFTQGEVVKVKSSKIVAGQEVERTNEFLQLLSIAILKKVCVCARACVVCVSEREREREFVYPAVRLH